MTAITAATKTFQFLSNEGWTDMPKGAFKDCDKAGVPIRIKWSTGSLKVIRNHENVPSSIPSKEKKKASTAMAKKLAAAGFTVKKMVTKKRRPKLIDLSIIGASPAPATKLIDMSLIGA